MPAIAADAQTDAPTLAVLNFSNRTPGDGSDWLDKGLADMLITDLSVTDKLRLVTREDMQSMFDEMRLGASGAVSADSAQQFGKMVQADLVLTGTFALKGNLCEMEAHVVEIGTQNVRRVEVVAGQATDVLKLEKELALNVVKNFNVPLSEGERASLMRMPTQSVDAGKCLYEGLDAHDRGESYDAIAAVRKALEKDPAFDRARFELGGIYRAVLEFHHADVEFARLVVRQPRSPFAAGALLARAKLKEKFFPAPPDSVIAAYDEVAKCYPESDLALSARFRAAVLAYETDKVDLALELFDTLGNLSVGRYGPGCRWMRDYGAATARTIRKNQENPNAAPKLRRARDEKVSPRIELAARAGRQSFNCVEQLLGSWNKRVTVIVDAPAGYAIRSAKLQTASEESTWRVEVCEPVGRTLWTESASARKTEDVRFDTPLPALVLNVDCGAGNRSLASGTTNSLGGMVVLESVGAADATPQTVAHSLMLKHRPLPLMFVEDALERFLQELPSDAVTLPPMESGAFYPSMAQDAEGRHWIVFNDQCGSDLVAPTGGDADLWISSSPDGRWWSRPERLPVSSDGHDFHPWLMVDQQRNLRLVWASMRRGDRNFEILTSISRDGASWSVPRLCKLKQSFGSVEEADKERRKGLSWGNYCPRIVQDKDGRYWMAYLSFVGVPGGSDEPTGCPLVACSDDGFNWQEQPEIQGISATRGPLSFVQGSDGSLNLSGVWGKELRVTSLQRGGPSWQARSLGLGPEKIRWPNLSVDREGNFYLAYHGINGRLTVIASRNAERWSGPQLVGTTGSSHGAPFLFHDREGNHWLVGGTYHATAILQSIHLLKVTLPAP